MASRTSSLTSKLVDRVEKLPAVLTVSGVNELDGTIGELVDLLHGELFNLSCELLACLNIYKEFADLLLHKNRPAEFADTDRVYLATKTTTLKCALLSGLEEIQRGLGK